MVEVYQSDKEQIEHLKKLWHEYGMAIAIGIVIALIAGFGWRYWMQKHENTLVHASARYEQLLTNVVNGNSGAVRTQAVRLMDRYHHTPYAAFAALQVARQDVEEGNLSDAENQLVWAMKHGKSSSLREVARIRAARVLLAEQQPQQALTLLNQVDDPSFMATLWQVRGDVLVSLGKPADAKVAYQNALKAFPDFEEVQPLLEMKINDLANANNKKMGA